jgi:hypothetical protein
MTSVASLRTDHVNHLLRRIDASTRPWSTTQLDAFIGQALEELWPTVGLFATDDVPSDPTTMIYTVPATILRVSRIDLVDATSGFFVDIVRNWRPIPCPVPGAPET